MGRRMGSVHFRSKDLGMKTKDEIVVQKCVEEYVNNQRWDTLVAKAWNMQSNTSRQEFIDFLSKHVYGVMEFHLSKKKND